MNFALRQKLRQNPVEHEVTIYVEVPVKITGHVYPGEPADYSERSPCPASYEEVIITSVSFPSLPIPANLAEGVLEANNPDWWQEADKLIIQKEKGE